MSTSIFLIRPKPLDDELLSSWIVRVAWHNVEKLESFSSKHWGTRSQIWTCDIDRFADAKIYQLIAEKCGVDSVTAWRTTLASYEGILFEHYHKKGTARWLMPTGGRKRRRFLFGLQCCPLCLNEKTEPYYRKKWRLAFITACLKHRVMLIDRCDKCGAPISFHESDFKKQISSDFLHTTFCKKCGRDYRNIPTISIDNCYWGKSLIYFQSMAERAMENEWAYFNSRTIVPSVMFFEGVHHLLRALASNSHSSSLRESIAAELGVAYVPTLFSHGCFTERLSTKERFYLFGMVGWLLEDWPNRFISCSKKAHLSGSYFQSYREILPYWLSLPIKWYLDRTWYKPNKDEIQAVVAYLDRCGLPVNRNNISKWLGRWYVTRLEKEKLISLDVQFPVSEKRISAT